MALCAGNLFCIALSAFVARNPCDRVPCRWQPTEGLRSLPEHSSTIDPQSLCSERRRARPRGPRTGNRSQIEAQGEDPVAWLRANLQVGFPAGVLGEVLPEAGLSQPVSGEIMQIGLGGSDPNEVTSLVQAVVRLHEGSGVCRADRDHSATG